MTIAAILIAGIVLGFFAGYILHQKMLGMAGIVLLSLAGAFVGGFFLTKILSMTQIVFVDALIASIIGAIIFISVIGLFKRTETRSGRV